MYLNIGTGNAWAGQIIVKLAPIEIVAIVKLLCMFGNLGLVVPTGTDKEI
jgi:hypothetical protein